MLHLMLHLVLHLMLPSLARKKQTCFGLLSL